MQKKSYKKKSEDIDDFFKEVVELFDRVKLLEESVLNSKKDN